MRESFTYFIVLIVVLISISCEKVIEIDLNSTNPRLVVEGYITDQPGPYTVKLTKTGNFFDANQFDLVSSAAVTISDDLGNVDVLTEQYAGIYQTTTIQGAPGRTYSLKIVSEGEEYTATSYMPQKGIIDSLTYTFNEATTFTKEGYFVTLFFTDFGGEENQYRIDFEKNGEVPDSAVGEPGLSYMIFEDDFVDGQSFDYEFYQYLLNINDTITVEVFSIDQDGYDFYNTLNSTLYNSSGGGFSEPPQNPITNISNDGLGYFGAFSISKDTIVIQ